MEKDGSQQASEELEQEVAEQAALTSTGGEEAPSEEQEETEPARSWLWRGSIGA